MSKLIFSLELFASRSEIDAENSSKRRFKRQIIYKFDDASRTLSLRQRNASATKRGPVYSTCTYRSSHSVLVHTLVIIRVGFLKRGKVYFISADFFKIGKNCIIYNAQKQKTQCATPRQLSCLVLVRRRLASLDTWGSHSASFVPQRAAFFTRQLFSCDVC